MPIVPTFYERLFGAKPSTRSDDPFKRRTVVRDQADRGLVDHWEGISPRGFATRHLLVCRHFRANIASSSGRNGDRRTPFRADARVTHEFFLYFTEPPGREKHLVWRAQLDLGFDLWNTAHDDYSIAMTRYNEMGKNDDSYIGEGAKVRDRLMKEMSKQRQALANTEKQIDQCARRACDAIALALETASYWKSYSPAEMDFWTDVAGFAILQCEHLRDRVGKREQVSGVLLDGQWPPKR